MKFPLGLTCLLLAAATALLTLAAPLISESLWPVVAGSASSQSLDPFVLLLAVTAFLILLVASRRIQDRSMSKQYARTLQEVSTLARHVSGRTVLPEPLREQGDEVSRQAAHDLNGMLETLGHRHQAQRQEIDRRRRNELELGQRLVDMEQSLAQTRLFLDAASVAAAEEKDASTQMKQRFLAIVSHELLTPMNGILGLTELALDGNLPDEEREMVGLARGSALHLLELIQQILLLTSLEADKQALGEAPHVTGELLGGIVRSLEVDATDQGLSLAYLPAPDLPPLMHADKDQLTRLLRNLIGNAIKHAGSGEITVRAGPLPGKDTHLHIQVDDSDSGIPVEKQALLFTPFSQADDSLTRQRGGLGIGLAVAAKLVERMGGTLKIDSEPGKGCHVDIQLPLRASAALS